MPEATDREDRLSRLESRVQELSRVVERLEERLRVFETARVVEERSTGPPGEAGSADLAGPVPASDILTAISLTGRTLLVLGGGYFLRALTESGTVAPLGGVAFGLFYALAWVLMADRAGAAGRRLNAAFHGAGAVLVAFPLLWETTARFGLLSPEASAICLSLVSVAAVTVSWRWRLRGFAWVTVVGATVTSFSLIVGTRQLAPFTWILVGVAVATYWLTEHTKWPFLHWVVAAIADIAVVLVTLGSLIERSGVSPAAARGIPLSLFFAFAGSFAYRLFRQKLSPGAFELAQMGAVLALGYGGALLVSGPALARILGVGGIVAAIICYRYALVSASLPARGPVYLEGTAAGLLLLGNLAVVETAAGLFAVAGVGLTWVGLRFDRSTLSGQGAMFAFASAVSSGLVEQGAYAYLAPSSYAWQAIDLWWLTAFMGTAFAYAIPTPDGTGFWWERWRAQKLLLLSVLVWALGGAVLAALAPRIAGTPGVDASPGVLATVRTSVLSVSSLVLAGLSRLERFREAGWLVYPVLLFGAIKLVIEDFPHGHAATLFVALAFYGGAVFIAPRLSRTRR